MATHSPMLMAYPNAQLLRLSKYGLEPVSVRDTDHYKVMREFCEENSIRTGYGRRSINDCVFTTVRSSGNVWNVETTKLPAQASVVT